MYRALEDCLRPHDSNTKKVLAISHSSEFGQYVLGLKEAQYVEANYPEHNMLDLRFESGSFDFCISDQVLEHVEGNPFLAFHETARVVKSGGFICHTTCFVNEVHGVPKDFWRFTPDALALLSESAGCRTISAAGWGNREAWALIKAGFRFERIPTDPAHPLHQLAMRNETDVPIHVWVVAQKH
jgi:SAM-dependent methyltransferase